jgi:hypothetical protein
VAYIAVVEYFFETLLWEIFMEQRDLDLFKKMPPPESCRLIDFDKAVVVPGFIPKTFFLIVSGTKPWVTMDVSLRPRIYIVQPDYWGIEVVGCQSGIGLPQTAPYHVSLEITHVLGKAGIEVIGATNSLKIKVP